MNDILAKILAIKTEEVATARQMRSEAKLLHEAKARQDVRGFAQAIEDKIAQGKPGIIAEIKKASSSKMVLREHFSPAEIAASYAMHDAACLSVLTDVHFSWLSRSLAASSRRLLVTGVAQRLHDRSISDH